MLSGLAAAGYGSRVLGVGADEIADGTAGAPTVAAGSEIVDGVRFINDTSRVYAQVERVL